MHKAVFSVYVPIAEMPTIIDLQEQGWKPGVWSYHKSMMIELIKEEELDCLYDEYATKYAEAFAKLGSTDISLLRIENGNGDTVWPQSYS